MQVLVFTNHNGMFMAKRLRHTVVKEKEIALYQRADKSGPPYLLVTKPVDWREKQIEPKEYRYEDEKQAIADYDMYVSFLG